MIKLEDLKLIKNIKTYLIGRIDVDYRTNCNILLTVYTDGSADIVAGSGTNNPHGLQTRDLHNGKYPVPYFCYKVGDRFSSSDEAIDAFNKWHQNKLKANG